MNKSVLFLALFSLLNSSCAYFQSNKNIREGGKQYQGSQLKKEEIELVSQGQQWFIKAPALTLQKSYPLIYDSILLTDNNSPSYSPTGTSHGYFYLPISPGTATTLTMPNGYANMQDLAKEITDLQANKAFATSLPHAGTHHIAAHLEYDDVPTIINYSDTAQEISLAREILSTANFVLLDVPGTVLYNVAIPFMAPIVFFNDFLKPED